MIAPRTDTIHHFVRLIPARAAARLGHDKYRVPTAICTYAAASINITGRTPVHESTPP